MIGRTESLTLEQVDLGSTRYRSSFWSFVDYTLSFALSSDTSWIRYTTQIVHQHNNPLRAQDSCGFPFGPLMRHCPAVARPAGRSQTLHPASSTRSSAFAVGGSGLVHRSHTEDRETAGSNAGWHGDRSAKNGWVVKHENIRSISSTRVDGFRLRNTSDPRVTLLPRHCSDRRRMFA
jgi:hypothetical protein